MKRKNKASRPYHHGNLAESLLNAVDKIASQFGLESVTLRGCAKMVGVSPSSAFRHYVDKRALMTAFATRALNKLSDAMAEARVRAEREEENGFQAVGLAYVTFALNYPAFFRAMWREETIYANDEQYVAASSTLAVHLQSGFADTIEDHDASELSAQELLAWSAVHGLANLYIDGPVANQRTIDQKIDMAREVIAELGKGFEHSGSAPTGA